MNARLEMILLADKLDRVGLTVEANTVDVLIKKVAEIDKVASNQEEMLRIIQQVDDTMEGILMTIDIGSGPGPRTIEEDTVDNMGRALFDVHSSLDRLRTLVRSSSGIDEDTDESSTGRRRRRERGGSISQSISNVGNSTVTIGDFLRENET